MLLPTFRPQRPPRIEPVWQGKNQSWLRTIPNLRMRDVKVEGFNPISAAAPPRPEIFPRAWASATAMFWRSSSRSWTSDRTARGNCTGVVAGATAGAFGATGVLSPLAQDTSQRE